MDFVVRRWWLFVGVHRINQTPVFIPWWWELPPNPDMGLTNLPDETDVAIIGSGFTGLSAALTLARSGKSVVILEAEIAGYGASTRNGGQVGSGNQKFKVQELVDLYGRDKAKALINAGTEMLSYIEELIRSENIECHFEKVGRFRGAMRPGHYEAMASDMEDLKRFAGIEYEMIPRTEQHFEVDTDTYHGGTLLPNDASLHPGLYHRGLLDRVISAGGMLLDQTRVTDIQRDHSGFIVKTTRGSLQAGEVIVATNGYTGSDLADFKSRIVPIGTSIIATEELPESLIKSIMPNGRVYGNTARVFHYFRPSPDGKRMLFGGRVGRTAPQNSFRAYKHLQKEMTELFPTLADVQITHCWSGYIAYTKDTLPHLGCHKGIWYAAGYCGTGVSRSTWFGHKVAQKILADQDGETPFDDLDFSPFQGRWAAPAGVAAVESWYRLKDTFDK